MSNRVDVDVCVVGSGASGSIVAAKLMSEGLRIALIEQGRPITPSTDYDDLLMGSEMAFARTDGGAWGQIGYPWTTCSVGGGTAFYGAASYRLRAVDFEPDAHLQVGGLSGRWPFGYDGLRSYYDEIESALGLSGAEIGRDPTHPGGNDPPLPPMTPSPQARRLFEAAGGLGLSPFVTPLMICTRPYRNRPACSHCSSCIEHQCASGARASAYRIFLAGRDARETNLSLHPGQKAVRLAQQRAGTSRDAGNRRRRDGGSARSGAQKCSFWPPTRSNPPPILLRSLDDLTSLANPALLGRGLCMKAACYIDGYASTPPSPLPRDDPWAGGQGPFSTIACTDFYRTPAAPTGLGGLIHEARNGWTQGASAGEDMTRLECIVADTPVVENRVRLAPVTDRHGVPLVAIDYRTHPRDVARLDWLADQAERWLVHAGYTRTRRANGDNHLGSTHLHGTCRAGHDPSSSVTAPDGRLHGIENVFVADGALMPFAGAVNPTLTIQALASKVADAVRDALGLGRPQPRLTPCPPSETTTDRARHQPMRDFRMSGSVEFCGPTTAWTRRSSASSRWRPTAAEAIDYWPTGKACSSSPSHPIKPKNRTSSPQEPIYSFTGLARRCRS